MEFPVDKEREGGFGCVVGRKGKEGKDGGLDVCFVQCGDTVDIVDQRIIWALMVYRG